MKKINIYIYILFLLSILYSCEDKTDHLNLNKSEFYIQEKTASLSLDELGYIWVGTEYGDVYRFDENELIHYDLKQDRVYKAVTHISASNDTLLWVAARNAGLQVWDIKDRQNPQKRRTYTISRKGEKYSPYDFLFKGDSIFVSTSLGLYSSNVDDWDEDMNLIYPSAEILDAQPGNISIVRNLCLLNDSILYAATFKGIKVYNLHDGTTNTLLEDNDIAHVAVYDDTLYATSKNTLYRFTPSHEVLKSEVNIPMSMFFKDRSGNNFFVGQKNVLISRDFTDYLDIRTGQEMPDKMEVNHLMVQDKSNTFSYLLTNNSLCRIPSHINTYSEKEIKASCVDEVGNIYTLTGLNELYVQEKGSKDAKWIFSFGLEDPISWIGKSGSDLYMDSISNTFYRIKLKNDWYKNIIDSPRKIFQTSSKITSTYLYKEGDKSTCYIGTKQGLFYCKFSA